MKNSFRCFAKVIKIGRDRIRGVVKTHLYKPNKAWNNPTVPFLEETSKQKGASCCGQFGTPGCSLLSPSALPGDAQPLRADSSGGDTRAAQPTSRRWHLTAPSTGSSWECRRKAGVQDVIWSYSKIVPSFLQPSQPQVTLNCRLVWWFSVMWF